MSKFPCSLTRNITSHSMENLAFHSLLRWKVIILQILATSLIQSLFERLGEYTFWAQEWKGYRFGECTFWTSCPTVTGTSILPVRQAGFTGACLTWKNTWTFSWQVWLRLTFGLVQNSFRPVWSYDKPCLWQSDILWWIVMYTSMIRYVRGWRNHVSLWLIVSWHFLLATESYSKAIM